jgi:hypothetical protein
VPDYTLKGEVEFSLSAVIVSTLYRQSSTFKHNAFLKARPKAESSSSCSYQRVAPLVDSFWSHASGSLFNGLKSGVKRFMFYNGGFHSREPKYILENP